MGSFFTGDEYDMPTAPKYEDAYMQGINALADSLEKIYSADSKYSGLFNEIFRNDQSNSLKQYNEDLWNLQKQAYEEYAPQLAAAQLAYEKEYAPQFIAAQLANQRRTDPTYWSIRDTLGEQISEDLEKGNSLTEAQTRQANQSSRAASAARGGSSAGYAPAAQEVLGEFLASEGLKTQRQTAAQNFLNKGANSYASNSYGGAAPTANVSTSGYNTLSPYMYSNAANAGANAVNYNNSIYNQQVQWAQNANNQPSMFSSLMGTVLGGIGSGAMAYQAFGK